jgi:hypothetical protein
LAAALADHAQAERRRVRFVLRTRTHAPRDRIARCRPTLVENGRSRGLCCVEHHIPLAAGPSFVRWNQRRGRVTLSRPCSNDNRSAERRLTPLLTRRWRHRGALLSVQRDEDTRDKHNDRGRAACCPPHAIFDGDSPRMA